jgi:ribonuclease T2
MNRNSKMKLALGVAVVLMGLSGFANAQVKMDGQFAASKACPAIQSIKKGTNTGDISVEAGKSYHLLGKNKNQETYYWVEVPGANPLQRWVPIECGTTDAKAPSTVVVGGGAAVDTAQGTVKPKPKPKGFKDGIPTFVLSVSWEPAFCEAMHDKAECKNETSASYQATHFSLHGLWPQPRRNVFCGVDAATAALDDQHQWEQLPAPQLSAETKAGLDKAMPGTQSALERHEWIKHGTCYPGGNADQYFKDAIRFVDEINSSAVQTFMAANIGKTIQTADLLSTFDAVFGKGAGERVHVSCSKDGMISELVIGLKGDTTGRTPFADLIAAAEPTDAGCASGLVDAVR